VGASIHADPKPRTTILKYWLYSHFVVETPEYGLTVFKVHFGDLTLKAYAKGERTLRFEAVVHNTRDLGCGRMVERFLEIVARFKAMLEPFLTTLDCADVAFINDQTLDQLPLPLRVAKTKVGGVDINEPRISNALTAVLALGPAPIGFSVAQLAAKVQSMTGQPASNYSRPPNGL
jgi:hypothetical protein